jgi:hypothetical protein
MMTLPLTSRMKTCECGRAWARAQWLGPCPARLPLGAHAEEWAKTRERTGRERRQAPASGSSGVVPPHSCGVAGTCARRWCGAVADVPLRLSSRTRRAPQRLSTATQPGSKKRCVPPVQAAAATLGQHCGQRQNERAEVIRAMGSRAPAASLSWGEVRARAEQQKRRKSGLVRTAKNSRLCKREKRGWERPSFLRTAGKGARLGSPVPPPPPRMPNPHAPVGPRPEAFTRFARVLPCLRSLCLLESDTIAGALVRHTRTHSLSAAPI